MREDIWLVTHGLRPLKVGGWVEVHRVSVGEPEPPCAVPEYPDLEDQIKEILDGCYTDEGALYLIMEAVYDHYDQ